MKKLIKKASLIFFVAALVLVLSGFSSLSAGSQELVRKIVVFQDDFVNEPAQGALIGEFGVDLGSLDLINAKIVLIPGKAVGALAKKTGVLRIDDDVMVYALGKPSSPPGKDKPKNGDSQPAEVLEWGVDRIDADLAWAISAGTGVKVAVIDTGIDKDHPDLVDNIKGGVNFVAKGRKFDPAKWDDDNGHGTHVAGIVGAVDNEIGVIGVAPQAHLYGVKVLDRNGSGYLSDVIAGIQWSIDNGMDVINMSLGTSSDIPSFHDAVDTAYDAGIVVVGAAGNSGDGDGSTNEVIYPAKYSSVIAVAATASDDSTPTWSSEGEEVELAAPGVAIRSTWKDGKYDTASGTSMASPHVAGTVALVLAFDSTLSPADVRAKLQLTADDLGALGFDNFYGYGLVDAEEAVK